MVVVERIKMITIVKNVHLISIMKSFGTFSVTNCYEKGQNLKIYIQFLTKRDLVIFCFNS